MKKELCTKLIGGNLNGNSLITTTIYTYDDETFEFKGCSSLYDGGEKANKEGYYTFDSVKSFIESKGKDKLIKIENNCILS